MRIIFLVFLQACFALGSFAANAGPVSFTYQGTLTNSSNSPYTGPQTVLFSIYNPSSSCLLYQQSSSVTLDSGGRFSASIGSSIGDPSRVGGVDPGLSMAAIFSNTATIMGASSCSYVPASTDGRSLAITVNGFTLSPSIAISAVPFATNADALGGYPSGQFFTSQAGALNPLTSATATISFNNFISAMSGCSGGQVLQAGSSGTWSCAASGGSTGNYTFSSNILSTASGDPMQIAPGSAVTSSSVGSTLSLQGGSGGSASGAGGAVSIMGGSGVGSTQAGGNVVIAGGNPGSGGPNGFVLLNGNVGINTATPSQALDVAGYINALSGYKLNNNPTNVMWWTTGSSTSVTLLNNEGIVLTGSSAQTVTLPSGACSIGTHVAVVGHGVAPWTILPGSATLLSRSGVAFPSAGQVSYKSNDSLTLVCVGTSTWQMESSSTPSMMEICNTSSSPYVYKPNYNGAFQVPEGCHNIIIKVWGAGGGSTTTTLGGAGGYSQGTLSVGPGQLFMMNIGSGGGAAGSSSNGNNNAGSGGAGGSMGGNGGGASQISYLSSTTPLLVAGGGGGAGSGSSDTGGAGGGCSAGPGSGGGSCPGAAANTSTAGTGGICSGGNPGTAGQSAASSGSGGSASNYSMGISGGGGGGGYAGGGGGGASSSDAGGGGGGSGYAVSSAALTLTTSSPLPADVTSYFSPGAAVANSSGNNGLIVIVITN